MFLPKRYNDFGTMLAHNQGQLFNAAQMAGSPWNFQGSPASRYLDLMVDLMLVRKLRPWHTNTKKRLVKSAKTYVRDSGLVHALLNISTYDGLLGHPVSGNSWEGVCDRKHPVYLPTKCGCLFLPNPQRVLKSTFC